MTNPDFEPPKPAVGDLVHTGAKILTGLIPEFGGVASELLPWLVTPPLQKRLQEWMELVGRTLAELMQRKGLNPEDLRTNPAFIDTVLQATQIAQRTSQKEKREALRNAILNSALSDSIDETKQQIFLNLIDVMTGWHLKILGLLSSPRQWFPSHGKKPPEFLSFGSLNQLLINAFPELKEKRDLYDQLTKELFDRGLVTIGGLHAMTSVDGIWAERGTALGKEFLAFISEPSKRN